MERGHEALQTGVERAGMSQNIAQILLQSLEKKNQILDDIIRENEKQEVILKQEELDMDALDASLEEIGTLVEQLERLDNGFESVYDKVRTEIVANKSMYQNEIARMQEAIQQITDKVVKINACRMRNQMRADNQFKKKAQELLETGTTDIYDVSFAMTVLGTDGQAVPACIVSYLSRAGDGTGKQGSNEECYQKLLRILKDRKSGGRGWQQPESGRGQMILL